MVAIFIYHMLEKTCEWLIHGWFLDHLQIAAYECEISKLREELLKEISHLEERKEEAVKAASSCSAEHFQSLQEQFFGEL